jgi:hypothetical protein
MSGLFDPINWSGWPTFGSIGSELIENTPQAGYQRMLNQMGLFGSQSPFGKYAAGQSTEAYNSYLGKLSGMAGTGQDPTQYGYVDFLKEFGPSLSSTFKDLSPSQRGERFAGGTPRARWIGWPS